MSIKNDVNRFKEIIRGKVRDNLKKYITEDDLIGKTENEYVKIPIPRIDIPNFRYGSSNNNGVGQGSGNEGDPVDGDGEGENKASNEAGEHVLEAEFTISELADMIGEKLELPAILPKGKKNLITEKRKYNLIAPVGPEGLKHFKNSFKKALKRSISSGTYNPEAPIIIPLKEDMRYKSFKDVKKPDSKAVIFYIMDVSGSMGKEQKKLVQYTVFWINAWLNKHYKGLTTRFIVHEAIASEVTQKEFFSISSNGGTQISSGYNLCKNIIEKEYAVDDWNIYVFHFSDGDNWSVEDTRNSITLIKDFFLPIVNSFNYGQVDHSHGSGDFFRELDKVRLENNLILSRFKTKDDVLMTIKDFLGRGK